MTTLSLSRGSGWVLNSVFVPQVLYNDVLLVGYIESYQFTSDFTTVSGISSINYNINKAVSLTWGVIIYWFGGDDSLYIRR